MAVPEPAFTRFLASHAVWDTISVIDISHSVITLS
jgi:hypothetical protein